MNSQSETKLRPSFCRQLLEQLFQHVYESEFTVRTRCRRAKLAPTRLYAHYVLNNKIALECALKLYYYNLWRISVMNWTRGLNILLAIAMDAKDMSRSVAEMLWHMHQAHVIKLPTCRQSEPP